MNKRRESAPLPRVEPPAATLSRLLQTFCRKTALIAAYLLAIAFSASVHAGNVATFLSQSVPSVMSPGQTHSVTISMQNNGTTTWSAGSLHRLGSQNPSDNLTWGTNRVALPFSVGPGSAVSFTFNVTAPSTPGTYNFQWRMVQDGVEWFGDLTPNLVIQVGANAAQFLSQSVPLVMTPGGTYAVSLTYKNVGSTTWTAGGLRRLGSWNGPDNMTWGSSRVNLPANVPPGGTVTYSFNVIAPSTPGYYNFQWRSVHDGVEWFGDPSTNLVITVGANNAAFVSQTVPGAMEVGKVYPVSVTMKNTGTTTWTQGMMFRLGAINPIDNTNWGSFNRVELPASVAPGANATFNFNVTAPATAGVYNFQWQMVEEFVQRFGAPTTNVPVSVNALAIEPASYAFGNGSYGVDTLPATFTVRNASSSAVQINEISTSGPDFAVVSNTCPLALPAAGQCSVQVVFSAAAIGMRSGFIRVHSSSVTSPQASTLQGTGLPQMIQGVQIADKNAGGSQGDDKSSTASHMKSCTPPATYCGDGPVVVTPGDNVIVVTATRPPGSGPFMPIWQPPGLIIQGVANNAQHYANRNLENTLLQNHQDANECSAELEDPLAKTSIAGLSKRAQLVALSDLGINTSDAFQQFALDPINSGTGNKYHEQVDYRSPALFGIEFIRTYNSQPFESFSFNRQDFGPGWISNWDRSVNVSADLARVTRGDGKSYLFQYSSLQRKWLASAGALGKLTQLTNASGLPTGWQYEDRQGVKELFDTSGKLTTLNLPDGKVYALSYRADGLLLSIISPFGRTLRFDYDSRFRVVELVDSAGGRTRYTYDSRGRLQSVIYPDGAVRQYRYEHAKLQWALTSIIDELGNTYVTFSYDNENRATGNVFAGGTGAGTIAYTTPTTSTTTLPDGSAVSKGFVTNAGKVQVSSATPSCTGCPYTTNSYDGEGQLITTQSQNGISTTYAYDDLGRPTKASTKNGAVAVDATNVQWHSALGLPTRIWRDATPSGGVSYSYDAQGRLVSESVVGDAGELRTTSYSYNSQGLIWKVDGPRTDLADITTYTYDAIGNVTSIVNALGHVTQITSHDGHGNPLSVVYPNGTSGTFTYDSRGRLVAATAAFRRRSYIYNVAGLVVAETDFSGIATKYLYDNAHRLVGKERFGERIQYTLDDSGRTVKTEVFDSGGALASVSSKAYDGLGRVTTETDSKGQVTRFTYPFQVHIGPRTVTDPLGNRTEVFSNEQNEPTSIQDALGNWVQIRRDSVGRIASVTDAGSVTTDYTHSSFGEVRSVTSPDAGTSWSSYNQVGSVSSAQDAHGAVRTISYDALNRIVQVQTASSITSYTYDSGASSVGRLSSVAYPGGSRTYTYSAAGEVTSVSHSVGGISKSVQYVRDAAGRIVTMTYPSGRALSIAYLDGRISSMAFGGSPVVRDVQYFPFGPAESWLMGAGSRTYTRYFDKDGKTAKYLMPGAERILTYDAAGRVVLVNNVVGEITTSSASYAYDNVGRLVGFTGPVSGSGLATQTFAYDGNGNRTTNTLNGVSRSYSYSVGTNRLHTISEGGAVLASVSYDAAGSISGDGNRTFAYDSQGRLAQATFLGVTAKYDYNEMGLRIRKVVGTATSTYVHDDSGRLLGEYDGTGTPIQELIWLDETPIAVSFRASDGTYALGFIWTDQVQTPRAITVETQPGVMKRAWEWDSLPFGETLPNENPSGLGRFEFNHRFPGQYFDAETRLHQNWNRYYDPHTGRYVSADPIGLKTDWNIYRYGASNPISNSDRTGLTTMCELRFLNNTYGEFGGFLADFFNLQQFTGEEYQKALAAALAAFAAKGGAIAAFKQFGICVYRAAASIGGQAARNLGFQVSAGASMSVPAITLISAAITPFATAAMREAQQACINEPDP